MSTIERMTSAQKLEAISELHTYINTLSIGELREQVGYLNAVAVLQEDDELYDYHNARWQVAANTLYAWELEEEIDVLRDRQQEFLDDVQKSLVKYLPEFQPLSLAKPALVA